MAEPTRQGPRTERLILRAFEPGDAPAMFELFSNPEVMRYTGEPMAESIEACRRDMEAYSDFERHGFGRAALVLHHRFGRAGERGFRSVLEKVGMSCEGTFLYEGRSVLRFGLRA